MEVQGRVIQVLPTQSGTSSSGNAWEKSGFVIETGGQYPKQIAFEVFNSREVADLAQVGREVIVSVNLESREYKDRWYTTARAWKVRYADGGSASQPQPQPGASDLDALFGPAK